MRSAPFDPHVPDTKSHSVHCRGAPRPAPFAAWLCLGALVLASGCRTDRSAAAQPAPDATAAQAARGVVVIHPDQREAETASGSLMRWGGVSAPLTGASQLYMGYATIAPNATSTPHIHTNCESAIFVLSGSGTFLSGEQLENTLAFGPGDFIYVPPDAPHQVINTQGEPIEFIVARNAPEETVTPYEPPAP